MSVITPVSSLVRLLPAFAIFLLTGRDVEDLGHRLGFKPRLQ